MLQVTIILGIFRVDIKSFTPDLTETISRYAQILRLGVEIKFLKCGWDLRLREEGGKKSLKQGENPLRWVRLFAELSSSQRAYSRTRRTEAI